MKPISLLSLLSLVPLLAACPQETTTGQMDESSSGAEPTTTSGGPTTTPMTTEVDGSSTDQPLDSSSGDPPAPCTTDEECDDGVFCNGLEGCVDGACVQGPPLQCDDGVDCTVDSCDEETQECINDPDSSLCGCAEICDPASGCGNNCVPAECQGHVWACGDCIDNDGDCAIDTNDPDCFGPCDDNETGWSGEIPGQQSNSECDTMDCYFDDDSGAGNDDCYWSHSCDPLAPGECTYDANHNLSGTSLGCDEAQMDQSMECLSVCGPLVPNGCDCFGCCDVTLEDGTEVTVYLGTHGDPMNPDVGTCNLENAGDPMLCNPCTQVDACLNDCGECELCFGQVELPPGCEVQECPPGLQQCGQPGDGPCPETFACITGCCVPDPQ